MSETIYKKWDNVPDGIYTKTQLRRDHKRKLAKGQQPVAQFKSSYRSRTRFYDLYDIGESVPVAKPSDAQLKALEKAREQAARVEIRCCRCGSNWMHENQRDILTVTRRRYDMDGWVQKLCFVCYDRDQAVTWARDRLRHEFVVLDTETTGKGRNAGFVQISVVHQSGAVLFDEMINPEMPITEDATAVHGITDEDVRYCSRFADVYPRLRRVLHNQDLLIYNWDFDWTRIERQCKRYDLPVPDLAYGACLMEWYAQYYGEYLEYKRDYKWQTLPGGDHSARGDCVAAIKLVCQMAR